MIRFDAEKFRFLEGTFGPKPEIVVCPPGYMVVNADTQSHMVFGAVCDRSHDESVRARKGLAYYPKISACNALHWQENSQYC